MCQSLICPIIIVVSVFIAACKVVLKRFSLFNSSVRSHCGGLLVASSMCWSLYRKRTSFARTDSIIMTSMAYSINSGLLTGLLSLASTISIVVSPSSMIWMAFFWAMSKCYVNSLLAMLNSRNYVRGNQSTANRQDNAYNISPIRIRPGSLKPTFEAPKPVARTIPFQSQA
ncbi:hypothetical protein EDB89DRAFT_2032215 [Lactarius sanguifluus]|nr:hypothetical protein EDB89DRAFT_2032215 [Lactarius sanguifluus]